MKRGCIANAVMGGNIHGFLRDAVIAVKIADGRPLCAAGLP